MKYLRKDLQLIQIKIKYLRKDLQLIQIKFILKRTFKFLIYIFNYFKLNLNKTEKS